MDQSIITNQYFNNTLLNEKDAKLLELLQNILDTSQSFIVGGSLALYLFLKYKLNQQVNWYPNDVDIFCYCSDSEYQKLVFKAPNGLEIISRNERIVTKIYGTDLYGNDVTENHVVIDVIVKYNDQNYALQFIHARNNLKTYSNDITQAKLSNFHCNQPFPGISIVSGDNFLVLSVPDKLVPFIEKHQIPKQLVVGHTKKYLGNPRGFSVSESEIKISSFENTVCFSCQALEHPIVKKQFWSIFLCNKSVMPYTFKIVLNECISYEDYTKGSQYLNCEIELSKIIYQLSKLSDIHEEFSSYDVIRSSYHHAESTHVTIKLYPTFKKQQIIFNNHHFISGTCDTIQKQPAKYKFNAQEIIIMTENCIKILSSMNDDSI